MPPILQNGVCPTCGGTMAMTKEDVRDWEDERNAEDMRRKVEHECRDCYYFLEAYEFATNQKFDAQIEKSESPDFICTRRNGTRFGIEVTRLCNDRLAEYGISNCETVNLSAESTVEEILRLAEKKGGKIQKPGLWRTKENILVFQLYNLCLSDLNFDLESWRESITKTLSALAIDEVWIADFVGEHGDDLEAYDAVDLFALHPEKHWGFYRNPNTQRKPFG